MRIFAAPDRLVRDPETRLPLPVDGKEVADHDVHWTRLLRDGDVINVPISKALDHLRDGDGIPVTLPEGDLAEDLANPGTIAALSKKADKA